ncbi:hypothetical protein M406DRAFT_335822 [Cryphonectria parasitica EP155]|uniref:Uncharacterized protein n=1 Tax=Cryphonectria parasitica (strain ATCC 38755 / EP155) TaxID=660469 RepID=A0A9P4YBR0_CRYP1|nr:uncharacterized protein M406DRAFT_335822 [Cryphonectria parasitica EP155]KAF3770084.1 hypothetical protein M406DRAFT_335822 [Cryphonectria parasitica EP155]
MPAAASGQQQLLSQASPPTDGSGDDEDIYGEDDAQSLIEPAMSPVVTRLTSPKTPAAEKMAVMDRIAEGYFERADGDREDESSGEDTPIPTGSRIPPATSIPPPQPQSLEKLPTPWRTGPKEIVVTSSDTPNSRPALGSALAAARHRRSASGGSDAFRRFSKALPSLSLPSLPNRLTVPAFFSSLTTTSQSESKDLRSLALRRSTSDESILYHSLSRMSSFGDDQRFTHIREQVNSRFKAIVDSFDPPSFKLPSMPNTLNLRSPLKKGEFSVEELSFDPSNRSAPARAIRGPKDPLDCALESLTGDLVIMGGYRGSVLRSAEPPHRQLWVPIKVGLKVRKVNLEVGLDPEDEERMEETIIPSGMLKNIGPVDISKRLFKRLRECENVRTGKLRIHDYGYDWRLSPHRLSQKLVDFMRSLPSNRGDKPSGAFVIAHSLGGIITRHAVNRAPELFSGVVYAGSPQRCINILGPLRNGDAVLLNEKVLTAHVNFSLRTTFVFLPEDGFCFVDRTTGEEYNIDFYNPDDWVKYRLCPSVGGPALPPFSAKRTSALGSFLSLSDSLSLSRGRSSSDPLFRRTNPSPPRKLVKDRTLAPQIDSSSSDNHEHQQPITRTASPPKQQHSTSTSTSTDQARNLAYLTRTLAETKRFRAELQHNPAHQSANVYPPIAVIYGKEIPTVYATRVPCREAIPCADVYDDLVFGSGDGVVLSRAAMPPAGYQIVRGGRVSTDKGHISLLGDLNAVGRAVESVLRGRAKGIGMGPIGGREGGGET